MRGHIARNCPSPFLPIIPVPQRAESKRQPLEADEKLPTRPRLNMNERLGRPRAVPGAAKGRGGAGNPSGRPVNPRNAHMTGVTCSHCGTLNHSTAQCWTPHPKLCLFSKKENVMMAQIEREEMLAYQKWEADYKAREERNRRYEEETE